ncbi:hypothetical protein ACF3N8_00995 [Staphylococcus massiliensis]|uniref:hypothetical protein n=1 Tax=Staphylococcus massiliensis TaxID=555791 RepID=UPI001EE096D9|nr:hypothetical protein [Staphylococcus massiliensis]
MRHYLEDGKVEVIEGAFSKEEVEAYTSIFGLDDRDGVSPLYLASVWPKFKMFQPFHRAEILLLKTSVSVHDILEVHTSYRFQLTHIRTKVLRGSIYYTFKLSVFKQLTLIVEVTQTFVQSEVSHEIFS